MKKTKSQMLHMFLPDDIRLVKDHLLSRNLRSNPKDGYCFVFDITQYCNLACIGCCVNARYHSGYLNKEKDLSFSQIKDVIEKISVFSEKNRKHVYINFGGGEPFIRPDFLEILKVTKSINQNFHLAIDTNGTLLTKEIIEKVANYASTIGISIDGLEYSHNYIRKPRYSEHEFDKVIEAVKSIIELGLSHLLEITTVATKTNLDEIPLLAKYLFDLGVVNYSIHRAMPVGRMEKKSNLIPDAKQYFDLYIKLIKISNRYNANFHIHHTLESIYSSILLESDTNYSNSWNANSNRFSSIGISAQGQVFTDPWFMSESWSSLAIGSILNSSLEYILSENNLLFNDFVKANVLDIRCGGCLIKCSGGSRICAASELIQKRASKLSILMLIDAFSAIDPACPLHYDRKENELNPD